MPPSRVPLFEVTTDTVLRVADSMLAARRIDTPDYTISKDTLSANIDYKASDSIVMEVKTRNINLYSKAETEYNGSKLTADHIVYDQDRNVVVARPGGVDSAGNLIGQPKMTQTDNIMHADSIVYNIKSQKGITQ
ncbi:MAG TPA: hypothetical protein VGM89_18775, partial [Puia sp.]